MGTKNIFISTDNVVTWNGMKDSETGEWINDADQGANSVIMSLFHKDALNPNTGLVSVAEVQTLLPDAAASAGTFTLTYEGDTTAAIDYDASFATIKTALELLDQVDTDDIQPGGNLLTANPSLGGMTFTFINTLGDVNLLEFDFTNMTGPTNAASTMTETTKGVLSGYAIDETGEYVGLPIDNNGLAQSMVGEMIRIEGSDNFNDEQVIYKVRKNKIVFGGTYVEELFTGNEQVYIGVEDGTNISLAYVAASNGNYRGILPDTLKNLQIYESEQTVSEGLRESGLFYLFIEVIRDLSRTTKRIEATATYDSS